MVQCWFDIITCKLPFLSCSCYSQISKTYIFCSSFFSYLSRRVALLIYTRLRGQMFLTFSSYILLFFHSFKLVRTQTFCLTDTRASHFRFLFYLYGLSLQKHIFQANYCFVFCNNKNTVDCNNFTFLFVFKKL